MERAIKHIPPLYAVGTDNNGMFIQPIWILVKLTLFHAVHQKVYIFIIIETSMILSH